MRARDLNLVAGVVVFATATLTASSSYAGSAETRQAKTHLGGRVETIVHLVNDCSSPSAICGNPRCLTCAPPCQPGSADYPTCCGTTLGGNNCSTNVPCATDADCPAVTCLLPGNVVPQACLPVCSLGDRAGQVCHTAADCPHVFVQKDDVCTAIRSGGARGQGYAVPARSALVVTDVLIGGDPRDIHSLELSSDDKTIDITLGETQHFTAGLVFPSGSHITVRGMSTAATVQLVGYLVKTH